MIFLSCFNLHVTQKNEQVNLPWEISSDDAYLSSLMRERVMQFSKQSKWKQGKQISNNYAPCFNRIDFVVIASYIERSWM